MSTSTVEQELQELRQSVAGCPAAKTETIGSPSVGDVVRQGDVYLVCIDNLPQGKELRNAQLAPGTSQGSRHIIQGDCKIVEVTSFRLQNGKDVPSPLIGPAFSCTGACEVTHPEHGHKVLPANSTWQVVYQLDHADEVRRVQD